MAAPLNHRLYILIFSLKDSSHGAIGKIPDPTSDVVSDRLSLGVVTEIHSLNNSFNNNLGSRFRHNISPGFLFQHLQELLFRKGLNPQTFGLFIFGTRVFSDDYIIRFLAHGGRGPPSESFHPGLSFFPAQSF